jgi:hypothetical protein
VNAVHTSHGRFFFIVREYVRRFTNLGFHLNELNTFWGDSRNLIRADLQLASICVNVNLVHPKKQNVETKGRQNSGVWWGVVG